MRFLRLVNIFLAQMIIFNKPNLLLSAGELLLQSINGTERQTDARPLRRPCSVYLKEVRIYYNVKTRK